MTKIKIITNSTSHISKEYIEEDITVFQILHNPQLVTFIKYLKNHLRNMTK